MGVVLHQLNYGADRHVNQQLLALERVNERLFLLYKPILITQVICGHVGVLKQVFLCYHRLDINMFFLLVIYTPSCYLKCTANS